jgi:hypothetical protein
MKSMDKSPVKKRRNGMIRFGRSTDRKRATNLRLQIFNELIFYLLLCNFIKYVYIFIFILNITIFKV